MNKELIELFKDVRETNRKIKRLENHRQITELVIMRTGGYDRYREYERDFVKWQRETEEEPND